VACRSSPSRRNQDLTFPLPPQRAQFFLPLQTVHLSVTHLPVLPFPPQLKHQVLPLQAPQILQVGILGPPISRAPNRLRTPDSY
jgi:hypothetical protein